MKHLRSAMVFGLGAALVCSAVTGLRARPASKGMPRAVKAIEARVVGAEKKEKRPSTKDDEPRDITFDDIKFEMERNADFKRELLTKEIEKLDDKPITIRGYMLPSFQQDGITQFVLVRDNMECCFGPGAMLFDCIIVDMDEGKSASYSVRPVTVGGVFTVDELKDEDGNHLAIYHLQAGSVK